MTNGESRPKVRKWAEVYKLRPVFRRTFTCPLALFPGLLFSITYTQKLDWEGLGTRLGLHDIGLNRAVLGRVYYAPMVCPSLALRESVCPTRHTWGSCWRKEGDLPSESSPRGRYLVRIVPIQTPYHTLVSRSQTLAGRESLVNCPYKTCSNTHPNWGGG